MEDRQRVLDGRVLAGRTQQPLAPIFVPAAAPANDEGDRARRSRASVPESAVHDALSVIEFGGAVAFDLTLPADHYFRPAGASVEDRLLEGLTDLAPGAAAALEQALASPPLLFRLREAFALLQAQVAVSPHRQTLVSRRFVIVHEGHVLFDSGLILDHAGSQSHTGHGPGQPSIYLPLELLVLVGRAPALHEGLRHLLEHADFHLRGDPDPVVIEDHPFSSAPEHEHIERLWTTHRDALRASCLPALQLLDAGGAAYWSTVLYLLGAANLVMADTVPVVLQRLETTGTALVDYLPQLHASFCQALSPAPAGTCFKIAVLEAAGSSVSGLLGARGVQLSAEVRALVDRPSAGVVSIRRTPAPAALAEVEAQIDAGLANAAHALARCPDADDLQRALLQLARTPTAAWDVDRVAEDFLLNRAEADLLTRIAGGANTGAVRGQIT